MKAGLNPARGRVEGTNPAAPRISREVRELGAMLIVSAALLAPCPGFREALAQAPAPAGKTAVSAVASDVYWVQVGVFRDADGARRVAQRLRQRKYRVQESALPPRAEGGASGAGAATGGADRYEVVVTGGGADDLARRISAKGIASRGGGEGVVITPSLPLSEAVALSRELGDDGLAVRVRRVGVPSSPASRSAPAAGPTSAAADAGARHRVRVGGYADRSAAQAALRELEALGYRPFITRGNE